MVLNLNKGDFYNETMNLRYKVEIKPVCFNFTYDYTYKNVLATFNERTGIFEIINFIYCDNQSGMKYQLVSNYIDGKS